MVVALTVTPPPPQFVSFRLPIAVAEAIVGAKLTSESTPIATTTEERVKGPILVCIAIFLRECQMIIT
jgi:hypothetical protein